jgi:dTDP-4-dehydrorhamnose reductase
VHVAESDTNGTFHLSGASDVSYYEFALCLARTLGVPNERVRGVEVRDRIGPVPAPRYSALAMTATNRLGLQAQPLAAAVSGILAQHSVGSA